MSRKLPAIQFYPGDWRKDPAVQSLDYATRGVWIELLMIMHECEPRGTLTLNNRPISMENLSKLLSLSVKKTTKFVQNLKDLGVIKIDETSGVLFNKRMVKDEETRLIHKEAGKAGGRPSVKTEPKRNQTDNQKQTPSSSSSSSTSLSSSKELKRLSHLWNEKLGDILPIIKSMKGKRRNKFELRLSSEGFIDAFPEILDKIKASDFLRGNDGGWRANFDWLIANDDNWTKIIEGNYDNGHGKKRDTGRTFKGSEGRSGKFAKLQRTIEAG